MVAWEAFAVGQYPKTCATVSLDLLSGTCNLSLVVMGLRLAMADCGVLRAFLWGGFRSSTCVWGVEEVGREVTRDGLEFVETTGHNP